jgi:hypothetical protein
MIFLQWLLLVCILLIILFQRVDVRVTYKEVLTVKISFIFFAVVFTDTNGRRGSFRRISRLLKSLNGIFHSLKFLLAKTNVILLSNEECGHDLVAKPPIIDLSLHFSLLRLIISAFILLYYIIKKKVKKVI